MANFRWRGGAATQTQVDTVTFAGGPWDGAGAGVTFTLTAENNTTTESFVVDVTALWTDTQVRDAVFAAIPATGMFAKITWATSGTDKITATAKTAGVPFYLTVSETDGAGTATRAATTANRGPNDVNTDGANGNWVDETGATTTKPAANGDVDILPHTSDEEADGTPKCYSILYGLYQGTINLLRLNIPDSFQRATVGDPVGGYYLQYDVNQATSLTTIASRSHGMWLKGTHKEVILNRLLGEDALRLDGTITLFEASGDEVAGTVRFRDGSVVVSFYATGCPQLRTFIGTSGTAITTCETSDAGKIQIDRGIVTLNLGERTDLVHTAGNITNYNNRGGTLHFNGTGNIGSTSASPLQKFIQYDGLTSFAKNLSGGTVNVYNALIYAGDIIDIGGLANVLYWKDNGSTAGIVSKGGRINSSSGVTVSSI